MNCPTNSGPYGYGGRTAETSVRPVRIIMFPASSSTLLVGKNARSTAALITLRLPPGPRTEREQSAEPTLPAGVDPSVNWALDAVVCSAGVERVETELGRCGD